MRRSRVMRHLTSVELVDLVEGTRAQSSAPHLATCEACRRRLAELRAAMSAASEFDVPEPSPLFWDHFSARVCEAVAAEGAPPRRSSLRSWSWPRLTIPLTAGAFAALVIAAMVTIRVGVPRSPVGAPASVSTRLQNEATVEAPDVLPDDPSLALVAELAAEMDWDLASEAGLTNRVDGAERAVSQLNADERSELDRLLRQALAKPGA